MLKIIDGQTTDETVEVSSDTKWLMNIEISQVASGVLNTDYPKDTSCVCVYRWTPETEKLIATELLKHVYPDKEVFAEIVNCCSTELVEDKAVGLVHDELAKALYEHFSEGLTQSDWNDLIDASCKLPQEYLEWVRYNTDEVAVLLEQNFKIPDHWVRNLPETPILYTPKAWDIPDSPDPEVWIPQIKVWLGINSEKYDSLLHELLDNAPYGGPFGIMFSESPWMVATHTIRGFRHPILVIPNYEVGAGYHVYSRDLEVWVDKEQELLIQDLSCMYNYTDAVCGMATDWCSDTKVIWE